MNAATLDFRFAHCGWAFSLPIMLIAFLPIASGQCSQAPPPQSAPDAQSVTSVSNPPAAAANGTSSSEATNAVRFSTGTAITVLEDTPLQVINDLPISSRSTKPGAKLSFTVARDVIVDGILVIPCGASVSGTVVSAKQAGRLAGASNLTLQLTALNLDGKSYPLYTPPFKVVGASKTRPTANRIATAAAVGALAASATVPTFSSTDVATGRTTYYKPSAGDQAKDYAVFAGLGAGIGTAIAASSPPSIALIPAESEMEFTLASPIAVYPVDQPTAARLAQGMRPGGPVLYVRGESQ